VLLQTHDLVLHLYDGIVQKAKAGEARFRLPGLHQPLDLKQLHAGLHASGLLAELGAGGAKMATTADVFHDAFSFLLTQMHLRCQDEILTHPTCAAKAIDGDPQYDKNGNPIDIGSYVHVVMDTQMLSNNYGSQYFGNLAGVIAGRVSQLDEKSAVTYKTLNGVTQVWFPNFGMMDSLTKANLNALRGDETTPTVLHDDTSARATSDWTQLYRMCLRFLVWAKFTWFVWFLAFGLGGSPRL
jgi:hypothetical protein